MSGPGEGRISDRRVLVALLAVVLLVLGGNLVSALVPGLDSALAGWPLVVIILVAVTGLVLLSALRRA